MKRILIIGLWLLATHLWSQEIGFQEIALLTSQISNEYAFRVHGVGDVNGDLYPDFTVSKSLDADTYVHLYFGGANFDTIPDLTFHGEQTLEYYGAAITSGDLNGDGINDIVIGAPEHDRGAQWNSNEGRIYVYLGGTSLDSIPDRIFTGEEPSAQLGYSLEWSSDVDGDSYPDLLVGAPAHWSEFGRLFIFSATPGGMFEIDTLSWEATGDVNKRGSLGYSIAPLGDINADGLGDFLVAAPLLYSEEPGHVYLVYGDSFPSLSQAIAFPGDTTQPNYNYGRSVIDLGHLTGDSTSYFGINIHTEMQIYSCTTLSPIDTLMLLEGWGSISDIATAGDLNTDGRSDFLIGIDNPPQTNLYFGGIPFDSIPNHSIYGTGQKISALGDINQDGQPEFGIIDWELYSRCHIYTYGIIDGIQKQDNTQNLPAQIALSSYPNPFNANTTIQYHLPAQGKVTIRIHNLAGHEVLSQEIGYQSAGIYTFRWNNMSTQNLPSGVYFCTITVENTTQKYRQSIKITLLK